jgi:hypothetical protein
MEEKDGSNIRLGNRRRTWRIIGWSGHFLLGATIYKKGILATGTEDQRGGIQEVKRIALYHIVSYWLGYHRKLQDSR